MMAWPGIYYALAGAAQAPLDKPDTFLTEGERSRLEGLRFPARRDSWLLGRWAAKNLLIRLPICFGMGLKELEIDNTDKGAPLVLMPEEGGTILTVQLSLSHSNGLAFCAASEEWGHVFGVDLEKVEPRSAAFVGDFFTPAEKALLAFQPGEMHPLASTLIWSMKESMLKALRVGLHWDTRQVEVLGIEGLDLGPSAQWRMMQLTDKEDTARKWIGWWRAQAGFVLTCAAYAGPSASLDTALLEEISLTD